MKYEIKAVDGSRVVLEFEDVVSSTYGDCTALTIKCDEEIVLRTIKVKSEELKRLGKSL